MIADYFGQIEIEIQGLTDALESSNFETRVLGPYSGWIKGKIVSRKGFRLEIFEFVNLTQKNIVLKYRYHAMDFTGRLIFRYDNAPHFPDLSTFPHHKHIAEEKVVETMRPDIPQVLSEFVSLG